MQVAEVSAPVRIVRRARELATTLVQVFYESAMLFIPYRRRRADPTQEDIEYTNECLRYKMAGQFFRCPYDFLFYDENESAVYDDVAHFPADIIIGVTVDLDPPMVPIFPEITDDEDEDEPMDSDVAVDSKEGADNNVVMDSDVAMDNDPVGNSEVDVDTDVVDDNDDPSPDDIEVDVE